MGRYVIRRILQFIPVFLIATFGIFYLVFALPGDPIRALAGEKRPTNAQVAALEAKYNVNDPILVQYGKFLGVTRDDDIRCAANDEERALVNRGEMDPPTCRSGLLQGDFGESFSRRDVGDILRQKVPTTVKLGLMAFAIELSIGIVA